MIDPIATEFNRIDAAVASSAVDIRRAIDKYLSQFTRVWTEDKIDEDGMAAFWGAFLLLSNQIAEVTVAAYLDASFQETVRLGIDRPFNPYLPASARALRRARDRTSKALYRRQLDASRLAMRIGRAAGDSPTQLISRLRSSVGMTPQTVQWLDSYERQLRGGAYAEILGRQARARRFDEALLSGLTPSERQIRAMIAAYRKGLIDKRKDFWAENEAKAATEGGNDLAIAQLVVLGDVLAPDIIQVWGTTIDGRERPSHYPMNGQTRPYGVNFTTGNGVSIRHPHDPMAPASETLNCRCRVARRIRIL